MGKLGDLYFDVLLRDKTGETQKEIEKRLSSLGVNIGGDISKHIGNALKGLKADVSLGQNNVAAELAKQKLVLNADTGAMIAQIESALKSKTFDIRVKGDVTTTDRGGKAQLAQEKLKQALERTAQEAAKTAIQQQRLAQAQNQTAVTATRQQIAQTNLIAAQQRAAIVTARLAQAQSRAQIAQANAQYAAQNAANKAAILETRLLLIREQLAIATKQAATGTDELTRSLANNRGIDGLSKMVGLAQQFTALFAGGTLLNSLIRIRGEFDMQLISLKAILQSTQQATQLYSELQGLSVVSPFQFGQLVSYAKQLSAYQIPTRDLYDTTKRLADLSAGLGVDMNRIILAYGQVSAASVLRGTELRQFTEAGIPMVAMLADKFSELENRVVLTSEVFDKISSKEVPFEMVKEVLENLTEEGGMFYQMQERQAESLKGKVSNLGDAYAIMMNKIGESSDGLLKGGVEVLTEMISNYETLLSLLVDVGIAYGAYKGAMLLMNGVQNKATAQILSQTLAEKKRKAVMLEEIGTMRQLSSAESALVASRNTLTSSDYRRLALNSQLTASQAKYLFLTRQMNGATFGAIAMYNGMDKAMVRNIINMNGMNRAMEILRMKFRGVGIAMKGMLATAGWMALIAVVVDLVGWITNLGKEIAETNKAIAEMAQDLSQNLGKFLSQHAKVQVDIEKGEASTTEMERYVEKVIEKIQDTIPDADIDLAKLMNIDDLAERAKMATAMLTEMQSVAEQLASGSFQIDYNEGFWIFSEGFKTDLEDYSKSFNTIREEAKNTGLTISKYLSGAYVRNSVQSFLSRWEELTDEFKPVVESIKEQIEGLSEREGVFAARQMIDGLLKEVNASRPVKLRVKANLLYESTGDTSGIYQAFYESLSIAQKKAIKEWGNTMTQANEATIQAWYQGWVDSAPDIRDVVTAELKDGIDETFNYLKSRGGSVTAELTTIQQSFAKSLGVSGSIGSLTKEQGLVTQTVATASSYADAIGMLQNKRKELLEALAVTANKGTKKQEGVAAERSRMEQEVAIIEDVLKIWNQPLEALKDTDGDKDLITQVAKARYEMLKRAVEEFEKLSAVMDKDKALASVKDMASFQDVTDEEWSRYFVGDRGKALAEAFKVAASGNASDEAKKFVSQLNDELRKIASEDIIDEVDRNVKRIADAFNVSADALKSYESFLAKTGNEGLAKLLAFGDTDKVVANLSDLAKQFVADTAKATGRGDLTFESILGLDETSRANLPKALQEAFATAKATIDKETQDLAKGVADAMANSLTVDDKIEQVKSKYAKLNEYAQRTLKGEELANYIDASTDLMNKEILELKAQLLQLLPVWEQIFGDASMKSYGQLEWGLEKAQEIEGNAKVKEDSEGKAIGFSSSYTDEKGITQNVSGTIATLNRLKSVSSSTFKDMVAKNPFKALATAWKDFKTKDEGENKAEDLIQLATAIGAVADMGETAAGELSEMFDAMGQESMAEAMAGVQQVLDGIGSIADGFAKGGVVGGIAVAVGVAAKAVGSIFAAHDKNLEKHIAKLKSISKTLNNLYEEIERDIERQLGGAYRLEISTNIDEVEKALERLRRTKVEDFIGVSSISTSIDELQEALDGIRSRENSGTSERGDAYLLQATALKAELLSLRQQRDDALDKKNVDQDEIADYDAQIAELEDTVRYFAEDTLKELMNIDLKDWASQIGSTLVDAFLAGEDAAEAFDNTVGDIMKSVVNKMASLYILEPMMENLRNYLFGETGDGGVFGADYYLDEKELVGMKKYIDKIKNEGIPAVERLVTYVDGATGGMLSAAGAEESDGLSASIGNIKETQADLLASYVNAIRADVSAQLLQAMQAIPVMAQLNTTTMAQLAQMRQVAENTLRNAEATEAILALFNSVTMASSNGRILKV